MVRSLAFEASRGVSNHEARAAGEGTRMPPPSSPSQSGLALGDQGLGEPVELVEAALHVLAGAGHQFLEQDAPAVTEIGPLRILPEIDRRHFRGVGERLAEVRAITLGEGVAAHDAGAVELAELVGIQTALLV